MAQRVSTFAAGSVTLWSAICNVSIPRCCLGRTGVARRHRRATPSRTTRIQFHAAHGPRGRVLRNPPDRSGRHSTAAPVPDPGDGPDPLAATGDDEPGLGWLPDRVRRVSPGSVSYTHLTLPT